MKHYLVWQPQMYGQTNLNCRCGNQILPGAVFSIDDYNLNQLRSQMYVSGTCLSCSIHEEVKSPDADSVIKSKLLELINLRDPNLMMLIRQEVRSELQIILKEEAHDPDGAFSPAK